MSGAGFVGPAAPDLGADYRYGVTDGGIARGLVAPGLGADYRRRLRRARATSGSVAPGSGADYRVLAWRDLPVAVQSPRFWGRATGSFAGCLAPAWSLRPALGADYRYYTSGSRSP